MLKWINIILPIALLTGLHAPVYAEVTVKPFTTDGCSMFPDGDLNNRQRWLNCCIEHDHSYWQGGTWQQRLQADRNLEYCVAKTGMPKLAKLMMGGVRVGGSPFIPTEFRWGYAWDYLRGYQPLNKEEQLALDKAWKQYQSMLKPAQQK